jgi:hypothetical protein
VHDAKKWGWTVSLTDRLGYTGQIEFDHEVDMAWLEKNFADVFSWKVYELGGTGAEITDSASKLTATKFDSDAAKPKMVVDFKIENFDFKSESITLAVDKDFSGLKDLFIRPAGIKEDTALEFEYTLYTMDIPRTQLTYIVTITDLENGKGNLKFSHPVEMDWLEDNIENMFDIYLEDADKKQTDLTITATAWDSKSDGMVVDFTFPTFDMTQNTMYWVLVDGYNAYQTNLFILSASDVGFDLGSTGAVSAIKQADGGTVEKGGNKEGDVEVDDDDDDGGDGALIGGIIGGIIGAILICVIVYCCCIWCKKRKAQGSEHMQKQVQMKKTGDAEKNAKDGDRSTSALAQNNK